MNGAIRNMGRGYERRKSDGGHNTGLARCRWEVQSLRVPSVDVSKTSECELSETLCIFLCACIDVADEHSETLC